MGTFQVGLLLIGTFALLLALSVPVSVSIIISSVVTMASTLSLDLGTFVASQRMVGGVDSFSLLAVPFYILCGVLMNTGGIAQKLIDFAKILVGRIPGGLAHTNILGNTLFGSLSGSSVAASVAIGGVLIPMEEKEGYDKKFAAAVNIASAPTGLIIPPSGILIIYPVLAGCSVVGMIMSGYIPGLMWALACMVVAYVIAKKNHYPTAGKVPASVFFKYFVDAIPSLLLIVILTVVNLIMTILDTNTYFLFSASVPYYLVFVGMGIENGFVDGAWNVKGTLTYTGLVIALVIVAVYLLCWLLSKKRAGWLTAALVLFIIDTVALVVITFALYDSPVGKLVDFLLHIWAIVELVLAVRGSRKLKELPPTEEPRDICTGPEL